MRFWGLTLGGSRSDVGDVSFVPKGVRESAALLPFAGAVTLRFFHSTVLESSPAVLFHETFPLIRQPPPSSIN